MLLERHVRIFLPYDQAYPDCLPGAVQKPDKGVYGLL